MFETDEEKTALVKACGSCEAGILDRDTFCRWCGARQGAIDSRGGMDHPTMSSCVPSNYLTTGLEPLAARTNLHRVSGPLVSAVVATLATGPVSHQRPSFFARAITALISVPLWLMIVLLSPLDAYAAAKNLSRGL
jgi:hypothetical protein